MDFHTIGELHFVTTGAFGLPRYTISTHVGCHAISSNSNAASIGLRFFNFARAPAAEYTVSSNFKGIVGMQDLGFWFLRGGMILIAA